MSLLAAIEENRVKNETSVLQRVNIMSLWGIAGERTKVLFGGKWGVGIDNGVQLQGWLEVIVYPTVPSER